MVNIATVTEFKEVPPIDILVVDELVIIVGRLPKTQENSGMVCSSLWCLPGVGIDVDW